MLKNKYNRKSAPVVESDFKNELNIKVVTSGLKINQGRMVTTDNAIIPYNATDGNLYPNNVYDAISFSPTAKGVVGNRRDFTFGLGVVGGKTVVNRYGETLNQVFFKAVQQYAYLNSHTTHFNFNGLTEISEITNVDIKLVRKLKNLLQARIDNYFFNGGFFSGTKIDIFLYNPDNLQEQILFDGGFDKFKGNIYYYTHNNDIYSQAYLNASLNSAQLEEKIQVYNYASINNSFSASGVFKKPVMGNGAEDINEDAKELLKMQGADGAGKILIVEVPRDVEGKIQAQSLFESFEQNNVDKMYINQSKNAKENILRESKTPEILLGTSPDGMFNMASFNDAFDYYNAITESDRAKMEESFNKFWSNTVFSSQVPKIEIIPLDFNQFLRRGNGSNINNS